MALLLIPIIASTVGLISGSLYYYSKSNVETKIDSALLDELKKGVKLRHIPYPSENKIAFNQIDKLVLELKSGNHENSN